MPFYRKCRLSLTALYRCVLVTSGIMGCKGVFAEQKVTFKFSSSCCEFSLWWHHLFFLLLPLALSLTPCWLYPVLRRCHCENGEEGALGVGHLRKPRPWVVLWLFLFCVLFHAWSRYRYLRMSGKGVKRFCVSHFSHNGHMFLICLSDAFVHE